MEFLLKKINEKYFLFPKEESDYVIQVNDEKEGHKYRLALGLGTHPNPKEKVLYYKESEELHQGKTIYLIEVEFVEEEVVDTCCRSGCGGCPWAEEQRKLGFL